MTRETDRTPERLPKETSEIEAVIDTDQVDVVLDTLMEAYRSNTFPYHLDRVRTPQDERHMPKTLERGTRAHAMYLWNTCYYMRAGTKSTFAFKALGKLYDERPEFFECDSAGDWDASELVRELTLHGLGYQKGTSRAWLENAERMRTRYDGDPRRLYRDLPKGSEYEALLERVANDGKGGGFIGFQKKMTSMITYYLMEAGLIEKFNFPIPIDLHVSRVSIANRMITFPGVQYPVDVYSDEMLDSLRNVYFDYAERRQVDPIELCNAVWLLSESLCGTAPGNRVIKSDDYYNSEGKQKKVFPEPVSLNDPALVNRYEKTCRHCPVETTCDLNVHGGAKYYVLGELAIRGHRERFPDPGIFPPSFLNETT